MIELDRHIEILLLSNDCVIVPDLGGFMAHHVDARYDEQDGMFVPPIRTLGFNPQLRLNDSLLAQSYVEAYDISYPEAVRRIEDEVNELRQHLETEGQYELNDIGVLSLNEEGNLTFEPCEAGILTPELYGLGSFEMPTLNARHTAHTSKHSSLTPQKMPEEGAITIKMSWLRNAVAVAAAIIAFLMIGTPISNSNKMTDVQQSAFISVPTSHQVAQAEAPAVLEVSEDSEEAVAPEAQEIPEVSETTETQEALVAPESLDTSFFYIVMASQVSERNANLYIDQLRNQGFNNAQILVSGAKKIRRVVYGCYESEDDANAALRQLRSESRLFRDTWIMEVKD